MIIPMHTSHRQTREARPIGQPSLWPGEVSISDQPAIAGAGGLVDEPKAPLLVVGSREGSTTVVGGAGAAGDRHERRTPSFVCELPLRVGPWRNGCSRHGWKRLGRSTMPAWEKRGQRWRLVRQSRAYQHARTLPRHTPERTGGLPAARAAHGFTDAALQAYAKDCRHASRLDRGASGCPGMPEAGHPGLSGGAACMAVGKAKRVRFKGKQQLDTVEGKSNVDWPGLAQRPGGVAGAHPASLLYPRGSAGSGAGSWAGGPGKVCPAGSAAHRGADPLCCSAHL